MLTKRLLAVLVTALVLGLAAPAVQAETLTIQGSTTVYPIAEKAAAAFMAENPGVTIQLEGTGSGHGVKALIDGTTDIANASRFLKEKEIKMAFEKGAFPVPFRVAYDCILPVVHRTNPVGNLSMEQLKAVYEGRITNWRDLGGPDARIEIYSRDTSSGTYEVWVEKVMEKAAIAPQAALRASNGEMLEAVAGNPNAIGYIGIGYLDSSVKPVSLDGVAGSAGTALDGTYPVSRPLYMFTRGWPSGMVLKFINFVLDPVKGQSLVQEAGYLSLYNIPKAPAAPAVARPAAPAPAVAGAAPAPSVAVAGGTSLSRYEAMSWKDRVALVQGLLTALNYNVGPVDGVWGPMTDAAVSQFRTRHSLNVPGPISLPLVQALEARLAATMKY